MAKILICDDEPGVRLVIRRYAHFEGYETAEAAGTAEVLALSSKEHFDLMLLSSRLQGTDGFAVLRELRRSSDLPVVMLCGPGGVCDKRLGFELGVDDYINKPFSSKELTLRINAILRRSGTLPRVEEGHTLFIMGGFHADLTAYKVFVDGEQLTLAPKLYDLLFFLIRNKNVAVPREQILAEVWGSGYYGDNRTIDTHMKLLRKALGPYGSLIATLRGLGYRFEA